MAAANDARLEEVQAIVAAGNARLHHSKANVNGITLKTDLNFEQFTPRNFARLLLNNMIVRVTGGEHKVVLGGAIGVIGGAKNEVVLSVKSNYIFPLEEKYVTGANRNNFTGFKKDSIGGAKIDKIYGIKREHHIGPKVYTGPAAATKTPKVDFLVGIGKCVAAAAKNLIKRGEETSATKTIRGSKLLRDTKGRNAVIDHWAMNAQTENNKIATQEIQAGNIEFKSTETFRYEAKDSTTLEGGGAKCELGAAAELSKGGSIKCDGSGVSVNGKTLIN
ncbi:MAG: hypothetical protein U1E76_10745 [Planctomycetota bacterium]